MRTGLQYRKCGRLRQRGLGSASGPPAVTVSDIGTTTFSFSVPRTPGFLTFTLYASDGTTVVDTAPNLTGTGPWDWATVADPLTPNTAYFVSATPTNGSGVPTGAEGPKAGVTTLLPAGPTITAMTPGSTSATGTVDAVPDSGFYDVAVFQSDQVTLVGTATGFTATGFDLGDQVMGINPSTDYAAQATGTDDLSTPTTDPGPFFPFTTTGTRGLIFSANANSMYAGVI